YFPLLRQWLKKCDENHKCHSKKHFWPTRVIFVGPSDSTELELWETEEKKSVLSNADGYIALSHCWGRLTDEEKRKICTTAENFETRKGGFPLSDLPKTFQDAVEVTRQLGKKYLWIDALCIKQQIPNEGNPDFEIEAPLMGQIFGSAFCTLAASSAVDWKQGFLAPRPTSYDADGTPFQTPQYVCHSQVSQNFEEDVDAAPLNKRAWVLQERVLSRRTLHFTESYTYFECGDGVRCENLIRLKGREIKEYFLLDPRFPERLYSSGYMRSLDFIQHLFEKYAQYQLTNESDRNIAILSLMKRMSDVFRTGHRYGIFEYFRFRLLLWRPGPQSNDGKNVVDTQKLPSWSWMRYSQILFFETWSLSLEVPRNGAFEFSYEQQCVLSIRVRQLKDYTMKQQGSENFILDAKSEHVGVLWFDTMTDASIPIQKCVIVGRESSGESQDSEKTCYILLVGDMTSEKSYKRVGVGKIKARCISKRYWDGELC
ncbi:HET-domain-containing protein, partial [Trichodelitschia bisporula]